MLVLKVKTSGSVVAAMSKTTMFDGNVNPAGKSNVGFVFAK